MKKIIILFILLLSLLFIGCIVENVDDELSYSLSGNVVYNEIGLPDVEIVLSGDSQDYTVSSDEEGNFDFRDVPEGIYTLYPVKTGYSFTPSIYYIELKQSITGKQFTGGPAPGFRVDPWGYVWEDIVRNAASWEEAKTWCESLGGRLPTPTELYRNCHNNPNGHGGMISQSDDTYSLGTIIPHNPTTIVTVRLSDGAVANTLKEGPISFRCVWPDKEYDTFRKSYIYGPPGEDGFQVKINGGLFYMDTYDRPPVSYNAAVREAAFYHAYIPPESIFTAVIQDGLPNGSGHWIWTSDIEGWYNNTNHLTAIVRWIDVDTDFDATYTNSNSYVTGGYLADDYIGYFRCAGVKKVLEPNPKQLSSGYVDTRSLLTSTTGDQGAVTMFQAIVESINSGGHLPTHQEYMILVQSGLPSGSGNYLWTSDYYNDSAIIEIRWSGVNPDFTGYYLDGQMVGAWHSATDSRQYRPVYYPIDGEYLGPKESDCYGGRFELAKDLGNGAALYMWADMNDRISATYDEAIRVCHKLGGHLSSRRDMVELIVNGLPNGNGNWLWTSDKAYYDGQVELVKWNGTYDSESTYADQWSTDAGEATHDGTVMYQYRCVWTNEVRIR